MAEQQLEQEQPSDQDAQCIAAAALIWKPRWFRDWEVIHSDWLYRKFTWLRRTALSLLERPDTADQQTTIQRLLEKVKWLMRHNESLERKVLHLQERMSRMEQREAAIRDRLAQYEARVGYHAI